MLEFALIKPQHTYVNERFLVHDMFNWLTVLILLPLEVATGYLYHLANAIAQTVVATDNVDIENPQFLKVLTTPLTKRIVQVRRVGIYMRCCCRCYVATNGFDPAELIMESLN